MQANTIPVPQMIQNAAEAMRRGDKRTARYWAHIAASSAPGLEEPWLILAAVSAPRVSVEYLKQALLINPGSQRAMGGLQWAEARLAKQASQPAASSASVTQPLVRAVSATQPVRVRPKIAAPVSAPVRRSAATLLKWLSMPALAVTLACILTAWLAWPGSSSSALALIQSGAAPASGNASATGGLPVEIAGPALASTAMTAPAATPLPRLVTPTPSSEPTALSTDIPAATPDESAPLPANVAIVGNYTVQSGDTLSAIAQRAGIRTVELAAANQVSMYSTIYPGQVLGIPEGGTVPGPVVGPPAPATDDPVPADGGQYILVDISEQHLYAYDGDALVYSFVASTGMNNSTRVGVFHVLDKIPNAYGATWDLWMPNWMGIYYSGSLENGIHALPILSNGVRLWSGNLGKPISFGCVVLGVQEAQQLYDWAEVGTTVEIRW